MGNTSTTTIEDVYEEEKDTREYGASADEIINRIGILDEIEDAEIARWGRAVGEAGGGGAPAEDEEIARCGAYGSEATQSPRIGILDEIEDKEIARRGAYGGQSPRMGAAPALMDKINTSTTIEDRIRILSTEMIRRGLETEESFKRLRSYEKKRNEYRCLMEELARYYDRQTALGLPIEQPVLKTGVYMQHVILL